MKILHPEIPKDLYDLTNLYVFIDTEEKIEGANINDLDVGDRVIKSLSIQESKIKKTNFTSTHIERFELKDCVFHDCDFTTSNLSDSSWHVVEIIGSRCSGIQLQNSNLKNVMFKNCKIEIANFRFSRLENVIFEDCVMNDVDFYSSNLKNITFPGSSIENMTFAGSRIKNVDLTEANIVGVRNASGFRGITITNDQLIMLAPYFAVEFGILIK